MQASIDNLSGTVLYDWSRWPGFEPDFYSGLGRSVEARALIYGASNPYPGASRQDVDKLMTPDEIIRLKKPLRTSVTLLMEVAGRIPAERLLRIKDDDLAPVFDARAILEACIVGANWGAHLQKSIILPDDQWADVDLRSSGPSLYAISLGKIVSDSLCGKGVS